MTVSFASRTEGLSKEFGGVHAVADLSFTHQSGNHPFDHRAQRRRQDDPVQPDHRALHALSTGKVFLEESGYHRAARRYELAARGLSRTFQNLQIFFNMTALENVMIGPAPAAG